MVQLGPFNLLETKTQSLIREFQDQADRVIRECGGRLCPLVARAIQEIPCGTAPRLHSISPAEVFAHLGKFHDGLVELVARTLLPEGPQDPADLNDLKDLLQAKE